MPWIFKVMIYGKDKIMRQNSAYMQMNMHTSNHAIVGY